MAATDLKLTAHSEEQRFRYQGRTFSYEEIRMALTLGHPPVDQQDGTYRFAAYLPNGRNLTVVRDSEGWIVTLYEDRPRHSRRPKR